MRKCSAVYANKWQVGEKKSEMQSLQATFVWMPSHYAQKHATVKLHITSIKHNTKCEKVLFNIKLFVISASGLELSASTKQSKWENA